MNDFRNCLLRKLEPETISRLELKPIALWRSQEIELPGKRIQNLVFIERGVSTLLPTFSNSDGAEVLLAGNESVLGAGSMMGSPHGLHRVFMLNDGRAYTSSKETALEEFKRGERFHDLVLEYQRLQFVQAAQIAGCNARHSLEKRLSRWLLLCADRNGQDFLPLSHEHLASLLSSSRPTISTFAGRLQNKGLIEYSRGKVRIVNPKGLETLACECYGIIRDQVNEYIERRAR
jgi:CRP-like cAMP-binding protein